MKTFEPIERLRQKTALYIGEKSITRLYAFLTGYATAEHDYGLTENAEPSNSLLPLNWWFMHEFAKIKCGEKESTSGWCEMILRYCNGDESVALDRFFELFDEFKSLKMANGKKAVLNAENRYYNSSMKHCHKEVAGKAEPCYKNPIAVYICKLSGNNGFIAAVETEEKVEIADCIFRSLNQAEEFAKIFFGKIEYWQKLQGDNIDFGKPVF